MQLARVSTTSHWESYWRSKETVDEVYSNEDRIIRNLREAGYRPDSLILEVGAGTGRDSLPLAVEGAQVIQLDNSFHSLRLIKQNIHHPNVYPVGGDAFRLPFRDETFDIVFHQGLIEHFPKETASRMLVEQIRVLKPDGLLLVDVPQRYHPYTILKHILIMMNKWFAGWERSYSYPELSRTLAQLGLTRVHTYGEWMVPSLMYRLLREIGKRMNIRLPLYPPRIPLVRNIRDAVRERLLSTPLPLYTGVSIGIVARKLQSKGSVRP